MVRALLLFTIAAIVMTVIAVGGEGATPIPAGFILYQRDFAHGSWIEVRDLAGGSRHALTPRLRTGETRDDSDATWSDDGATVAFVRKTGKREAIYLVDADGSSLRQLVTLASLRPLAGKQISRISQPVWSADGSKLLFTVGGPFNAGCVDEGLFAVASDGTGLRRLWRRPHSFTATVGGYRWSPDGGHAVFRVDRDDQGGCRDDDYEGSDLYLISDSGTDLRRLATDVSVGVTSWSPDGKAIAYSVDCQSVCNLALAFTDGRKTRRLTHFRWRSVGGFFYGVSFVWSGRGREIVFAHPLGSDDSRSLYAIDANTDVSRRLVTAPCPGPKVSCASSLTDLYGISPTARVVVFDVYRDVSGASTTIQRYAAFIDEGRLVRLPWPSLIVDDVYLQ